MAAEYTPCPPAEPASTSVNCTGDVEYHNCFSGLDCPTITSEPSPEEVAVGASASFTVVVSAPGSTYQWQRQVLSVWTDLTEGSPFSGVESATLLIDPTDIDSGGRYRCVVSSPGCPDLVSAGALLTVTETPVVSNPRILLVGGGGAGCVGGGGGGEVVDLMIPSIDAGTTYTVVVGTGGVGVAITLDGPRSGAGTASSITELGLSASGGGGGGNTGNSGNGAGGDGASGGGGGAWAAGLLLGGTGFAGNNGGSNGGVVGAPYPGGGGGGAGTAGGNAINTTTPGVGGDGITSDIETGLPQYYGGGGGGHNYNSTPRGLGGLGGGGNGGTTVDIPPGSTGTNGTGGGGGGGKNASNLGWSGGSGVVIIRYTGSQAFTGGTVTTVGGDTVHKFTSSGTLAPI